MRRRLFSARRVVHMTHVPTPLQTKDQSQASVTALSRNGDILSPLMSNASASHNMRYQCILGEQQETWSWGKCVTRHVSLISSILAKDGKLDSPCRTSCSHSCQTSRASTQATSAVSFALRSSSMDGPSTHLLLEYMQPLLQRVVYPDLPSHRGSHDTASRIVIQLSLEFELAFPA